MIPRVKPKGMLFGKPLNTFPNHARVGNLKWKFGKGGIGAFRATHPFRYCDLASRRARRSPLGATDPLAVSVPAPQD